MREKGGRRRFRPGWMQHDAEGGVDNPAMTLEPVVSFSVGEPEDADTDANVDPSVAITVSDYDREDTSMV